MYRMLPWISTFSPGRQESPPLTCHHPPCWQMHYSIPLCMLKLFSRDIFLMLNFNIDAIWFYSHRKPHCNIHCTKKKDVKQRHIHNRFDNTPPRSRFAAAAGLPCFGLVCCADISAAWSWVTSSRDQKEVVTTAHCSRTSQSQDLGAHPEHTAL